MSGTAALPGWQPEPGQPIEGVGGQIAVGDHGAMYWELLFAAIKMTCERFGAAPVGTLTGGSHVVEGVRILWWDLELAQPVVAR